MNDMGYDLKAHEDTMNLVPERVLGRSTVVGSLYGGVGFADLDSMRGPSFP